MRDRYYAVNDRPVKVVVAHDGSSDIYAFDWTTGNFVVDRSYWEHIHTPSPFKDVDSFTRERFDELVQLLRLQVVVKHLASPIAWEHTGDGEFPLQTTIKGHRFTIRVNDFPADPLYTLMGDGEEIADLEDWPETWKEPTETAG